MRLSSNRKSGRPADSNAYWRRRFFILAVGLAVLVPLGWKFSGGKPAPSPRSSAAALQGRDTLPAAAYGSAWPVAMPTLATSTVPAATPSPPETSAAPSVGASGGPSAAATPSTAPSGPGCPPGDIVLSLFTSSASYAQSARPQFDVYAVSTARTPCQMAYGAGSVRVVVTRGGQVVWDSAACGSPVAKPAQFQLGVPQLLTVTWDRASQAPSGCAGSLAPGAWGTFDAVAMAAGRSSPVRTFTLLR